MLTLHVEPQSLALSRSAAVTGTICVWLDGGEAFPDPQWNDFVVVVLSWWTSALESLVRRSTNSIELPFMDGPYAMRLTRRATSADLDVDLCHRGLKTRVVRRGRATEREVLAQVDGAAECALDFCAAEHVADSDVQELARGLTRLRHATTTLPSTDET